MTNLRSSGLDAVDEGSSSTLTMASNNGKTSVLVVSATRLTTELMVEALRRNRGLAVNDAFGTSVLSAAASMKPDVLLLSEELEGVPGKGFEVLRELRAAVPKIRTVMLLDSSLRNLVVESFRSGARGVFCRDASLKLLGKCVRKVHEGQLWVNRTQLAFLLQELADRPTTRLVDVQGKALLSKREEDVVRCLCEGRTNGQIALQLKLSENTVRNYMFRIFNKLGVSSRVEVMRYAASHEGATARPSKPLKIAATV